MNKALAIENLWKRYRLGTIGHGTLTHDLQSWFAKIRGKEDPNQKIQPQHQVERTRVKGDLFWALRGIDLDVQEGDLLGIVGKNGAGKSTLLKIISRITAPTIGRVKIKGRIASLLEVGTGFHPELTGRENIFLNGAILGMTKSEIQRRLDEIIDFSGVEQHIDTPVKRYSSGMYVRLAFAVAGHLETEILIVDEVLAVGDAAFQKKCVGKMENISSQGRTILFVSHNLEMIKSLCPKTLLLSQGKIDCIGKTEDVIQRYLSEGLGKHSDGTAQWTLEKAPGTKYLRLIGVRLEQEDMQQGGKGVYRSDLPIKVALTLKTFDFFRGMRVVVSVLTQEGVLAFSSTNQNSDCYVEELHTGTYQLSCTIPEKILSAKTYYLRINAGIPNMQVLLKPVEVMSFKVIQGTLVNPAVKLKEGVMNPILKWDPIVRIED